MENLLFVCSIGLNRSPTAAAFFEYSEKYQAEFAGTHFLAKNKISREQVKWADMIFCMREKHKKYVLNNFPEENATISVLDIPVYHLKNTKPLNKILKSKLEQIGILEDLT